MGWKARKFKLKINLALLKMLLNKTYLAKWLKQNKFLMYQNWSSKSNSNEILEGIPSCFLRTQFWIVGGVQCMRTFFIHSITTKGRETAPSQPLLTCWPTFQLLEKLKSQMQQLSQTIVVLLLGRSPGISRGYFCTVQVCLRNAQFN